ESCGISLRKSSSNRKGSKSEVLPNPKARRNRTPAPSRVGLDLLSRLTGLKLIVHSFVCGPDALSDKLLIFAPLRLCGRRSWSGELRVNRENPRPPQSCKGAKAKHQLA